MGWPCDFNTISFARESPSLIGCRNWNCAAADSGPVYQRSSLLPLPPLQKPNPLLLVWGASHGRVATALRCSPCPDYVNVQLWLTRWLPRQRAALSAVRPVRLSSSLFLARSQRRWRCMINLVDDVCLLRETFQRVAMKNNGGTSFLVMKMRWKY